MRDLILGCLNGETKGFLRKYDRSTVVWLHQFWDEKTSEASFQQFEASFTEADTRWDRKRKTFSALARLIHWLEDSLEQGQVYHNHSPANQAKLDLLADFSRKLLEHAIEKIEQLHLHLFTVKRKWQRNPWRDLSLNRSISSVSISHQKVFLAFSLITLLGFF